MYESFFGFCRRPFLTVPDAESFFETPLLGDIRQSVGRTVRRGEGISVILGQPGVGKTLLLRILRQMFESEYAVAVIANSRFQSTKAFLQQLLYELRLPFAQADEQELRLRLLDFSRQETVPGTVLLIDESSFLNDAILEEIRLLTNCDNGVLPFFRVVLAGTLDFEERLTHPRYDALNQRIVSRIYLESLTRDETAEYIDRQIEMAANMYALPQNVSANANLLESEDHPPTNIFTDGAEKMVHTYTDGLPRLINQLCDAALSLAAEQKTLTVDTEQIQESWCKIQQIAVPKETPALDETNSSDVSAPEGRSAGLDEKTVAKLRENIQLKQIDTSIEFGTLDDDDVSAQRQEQPATSAAVASSDPPRHEYKPAYPYYDNDTPPMKTTNSSAEILPEPIITEAEETNVVTVQESIVTLETAFVAIAENHFVADHEITADPITIAVETAIYDEEKLAREIATVNDFIDETTSQETPMNQETLQHYADEVLSQHPVFFRKEPRHAYDTPLTTEQTLYPFPPSGQGLPIELCWNAPAVDVDTGFGTAYSGEQPSNLSLLTKPLSQTNSVTKNIGSLPTSATESPICRIACDNDGSDLGTGHGNIVAMETPFDEPFEEVDPVTRHTVSLDRIFRHSPPPSVAVSDVVSEVENTVGEWVTLDRVVINHLPEETLTDENCPIIASSVEETVRQQLQDVIKQISRAARRIEQAANVTETAGQKVSDAADYVETEIKASLPSYKELFQEVAQFHHRISGEITRINTPESPVSFSFDPASSDRPQVSVTKTEKPPHEQQVDLLPFPRRPHFAQRPSQGTQSTTVTPTGSQTKPQESQAKKSQQPQRSAQSHFDKPSMNDDKFIDVKMLFQ